MPLQINKTQKHGFEQILFCRLICWTCKICTASFCLMFMFLCFVCLCPFCAQVVLQVSFMCCVVEVLFDVVLPYAVLGRLHVSFMLMLF